MNAAELMKRLYEYGVDKSGLEDRFTGNDELYKTCFDEFMNDAGAETLGQALRAKDCKQAFEAAHALKGVAANLGLTAYYNAVSALTESLRTGDCANADGQYAELERQYDILKNAVAENVPQSSASSGDAPPARGARAIKIKPGLLVPLAILVPLIIAALVHYQFDRLIVDCKANAVTESSEHLIEINRQLDESIENGIENGWLTAYTISACVAESSFAGGDPAIFRLLGTIRDTQRLYNIILHTESGHGMDADGNAIANGPLLETAVRARETGGYMSIAGSCIAYTVPVETALECDGSRIAAVSVAKDMRGLFDGMEPSPFGGAAYMYLTDGDGNVISGLSSAAAISNVTALFDGDAISTLAGKRVSPAELLTPDAPAAFVMNDLYVVSTPVHTRRDALRLVYFVPQSAVNRTLDGYSNSVAYTGFIVLALFVACALFAVAYLSRIRRKRLDSAILSREHMFDLLVKNSSTAFGLFEINRQAPEYISSNAVDVMGDAAPALYNEDGVFRFRSGSGKGAPVLEQINGAMRAWDGTCVFRSGYIRNAESEPPGYLDVQLIPVSGEVGKYVGIAQDVTTLYERDAATRKTLAMAEHANKAKTRFLSNMSHDIRTPMNAIVNMADFAVEDIAEPTKLREHLNVIRESSDHLLMLINDILDMSRIESGNAVIDSAPFDLPAELRRLKGIVVPLCAEKEQTFITDFDGVRTAGVLGDQVKVSQILMNLLSNAIKFTPRKGAVRFTATELPSIRENYANMRFIVEDNGIGISKDFMPYIFSPFIREDDKRVSGIQGTGLGLSICHSYVTAMGGAIKCESEEGEGSTFTVELFFEKTDAPPALQSDAAAYDSMPFIGMRCLLCEDNPTNQRIARTMLERLGFIVELAGDGREGLSMFERSPARYYDVVYMDIQMPVMDGYEAAVALRSCDHLQAGTIPIIAMTANVFIEDIEKVHIAGMDGHVGKPVAKATLASETSRVMTRKRRTVI